MIEIWFLWVFGTESGAFFPKAFQSHGDCEAAYVRLAKELEKTWIFHGHRCVKIESYWP